MTDEFNIEFQEGGVISGGEITPEELAQAISAYFMEHPIESVTLEEIQQMVGDAISALNIHDGTDGKSAYQIAVDNGFSGTESEWLESLKGEKGDKGEQGIQGIQGIQGLKGDKGDKGADGNNGTNGADGKTAYELALDNGFSGTLAEWLASLKGEKGDKGDKGDSGSGGISYDDTEIRADITDLWKTQGEYIPTTANGSTYKNVAEIGQTNATFNASGFMSKYNVANTDLALDIKAETQSGDVVEYNNVTVNASGVVTIGFDALAEQATFICKCSAI